LMQLSRSSILEVRLVPRGRAIHIGTELPIPNVHSSVANGGKADKICSMRVLRILTLNRHKQAYFAAAHSALVVQ
jgi:hypothetical protein